MVAGLLTAAVAVASPATAHPRVPADKDATAPQVTLTPSSRLIVAGKPVRLTGADAGLPAGSVVQLFETLYPYATEHLAASTTTDSNGHFSFLAFPDRDVRYAAVGPNWIATASVRVAGRVLTKVRYLSLGRAEVTLLVYHPRDLRWSGASVRWSFTNPRGRRETPRPATTRSRRLSPVVTVLRKIVALPPGRFRWQACLEVPGAGALVNRGAVRGCTGRSYQGSGREPFGYPEPGAIARATAALSRRLGRTAFAVIDSEGRPSGWHEHWTFVSASVVKAMLLVEYLRMLDGGGQRFIDSTSNSFLFPMINTSDNHAATTTWSIVGNSGLYAVARAAGMTDYSVSTDWASSQISAADQARFFFVMDSLIPREFVGYARWLLSSITADESWGIPAVARPLGYRVFFKGGWRGTGLGQLVHQVGRLEGHGRTFSIAVMTDGDPSMGYGIGTIQDVTGALL
jgi:hypothetical protein